MKKKIGFIFETILTILIVGLCILIIAISKGYHPSIGGYEVLRVITPSMEPSLKENSIILIKHIDPDKIEKGDIITFMSEDPVIKGYYVTHRVYDIRFEENTGVRYFITKGDANNTEDLYVVHDEDIAGIYSRTMPLGNVIGKFIAALSDNKVYFLVVLLPIIVVLIVYIWQLVSIIFIEKDDDEDDETGKQTEDTTKETTKETTEQNGESL